MICLSPSLLETRKPITTKIDQREQKDLRAKSTAECERGKDRQTEPQRRQEAKRRCGSNIAGTAEAERERVISRIMSTRPRDVMRGTLNNGALT